jgi:ABC-type antimicrobial peptide transport system permease subunit
MAIGAQKHHVLRLVLNESTRPVLIGLMAGILLAAGGSYLARGVFYGLNGVDGVSLVSASVVFLAIALIASYPPARRAMGVDPIVALRYE